MMRETRFKHGIRIKVRKFAPSRILVVTPVQSTIVVSTKAL